MSKVFPVLIILTLNSFMFSMIKNFKFLRSWSISSSPCIVFSTIVLSSTSNNSFVISISPSANVSKHAKIEEGSIVMHGANINASATIGKNCIINTSALVEHDVVIEDHCHISTASVVNGGSRICKNTFIEFNVIKNVPDNVVVVGNPAKIIGENKGLWNSVE